MQGQSRGFCKDLLPLADVVTIAALTDKLLTISEKVLSFLSWVLYKTKKTYTGRFFTGSALKVLSMELVPLNREKNDWFSHKSTKKADEPGSSKRRNPFNISPSSFLKIAKKKLKPHPFKQRKHQSFLYWVEPVPYLELLGRNQ